MTTDPGDVFLAPRKSLTRRSCFSDSPEFLMGQMQHRTRSIEPHVVDISCSRSQLVVFLSVQPLLERQCQSCSTRAEKPALAAAQLAFAQAAHSWFGICSATAAPNISSLHLNQVDDMLQGPNPTRNGCASSTSRTRRRRTRRAAQSSEFPSGI